MRSRVSCGMEAPAGESFSTNDKVVGERPRCFARSLSAMDRSVVIAVTFFGRSASGRLDTCGEFLTYKQEYAIGESEIQKMEEESCES